jgi:hypothetical protein
VQKHAWYNCPSDDCSIATARYTTIWCHTFVRSGLGGGEWLALHLTNIKTWGSQSTASHILNLGTRGRWMVNFTPGTLYLQVKNSQYPLVRKFGVPQSRPACGEQKNPCPCWESKSSCPVHCHLLYWLSSSVSHCLMVVGEQPGRMKGILYRSDFIKVLTFGTEIWTWTSRDLTQIGAGRLCSWKLWIRISEIGKLQNDCKWKWTWCPEQR